MLVRFGKQVRLARLKNKLTQEELAKASGVRRTYIGMIERAERTISLKNIGKIADGLGIPICKLLKGV